MTCQIDGCPDPVRARGWCNKHWARWRKHGDPNYVRRSLRETVTCSIDGCARPHYGRGWCNAHYTRWYHTGDPLGSRLKQPADRFRAFVTVDASGCHLWTGATGDTGYGNFWIEGRTVLAHRYSYELNVGPIPDGLQVDHLCRVRACVNPAHLEPVTASENTRRQPSNAGRFTTRTEVA